MQLWTCWFSNLNGSFGPLMKVCALCVQEALVIRRPDFIQRSQARLRALERRSQERQNSHSSPQTLESGGVRHTLSASRHSYTFRRSRNEQHFHALNIQTDSVYQISIWNESRDCSEHWREYQWLLKDRKYRPHLNTVKTASLTLDLL